MSYKSIVFQDTNIVCLGPYKAIKPCPITSFIALLSKCEEIPE